MEMRVGSCTCIINALLRGAAPTQLGLQPVAEILSSGYRPGFSYRQVQVRLVLSPWLLPGQSSWGAALSPYPGAAAGQGEPRGLQAVRRKPTRWSAVECGPDLRLQGIPNRATSWSLVRLGPVVLWRLHPPTAFGLPGRTYGGRGETTCLWNKLAQPSRPRKASRKREVSPGAPRLPRPPLRSCFPAPSGRRRGLTRSCPPRLRPIRAGVQGFSTAGWGNPQNLSLQPHPGRCPKGTSWRKRREGPAGATPPLEWRRDAAGGRT